MISKLTVLLFLLIVVASGKAFAHADSPLVDEIFAKPRYLTATIQADNYHLALLDLRSKDLEILGVDYNLAKIDVYLNQEEYLQLVDNGYNLILSDHKNILVRPDQEYKNPAEIEAFITDIASRFPDLVTVSEIGRSIENKPIYAMKLATKTDEVIDSRPAVLFNSMHHAREVMTPEVAIDITTYLLENFDNDEKVERWLTQNQIWIVPMLNVDGNQKVWGGDSMWRKNTRGGFGVDINRNYPFKWAGCNGSSGSRWSDTYRGESAGSEPETQTLMKLVAGIKPVFNISFHSYSEMVLYPYGCQGQKTPEHTLIASLGEQMAKAINYVHGTPWEILYGVDGGDVDWMYAAHQVIPYVIEVSSSSEGFQPAYTPWRERTTLRVRPAWMRILNRLEESAVSGMIEIVNTDSYKSQDIVLVLKNGKGSVSHKLKPAGNYFIPTLPGNYLLEVRHKDSLLSTVNVSVGLERVILNVKI